MKLHSVLVLAAFVAVLGVAASDAFAQNSNIAGSVVAANSPPDLQDLYYQAYPGDTVTFDFTGATDKNGDEFEIVMFLDDYPSSAADISTVPFGLPKFVVIAENPSTPFANNQLLRLPADVKTFSFTVASTATDGIYRILHVGDDGEAESNAETITLQIGDPLIAPAIEQTVVRGESVTIDFSVTGGPSTATLSHSFGGSGYVSPGTTATPLSTLVGTGATGFAVDRTDSTTYNVDAGTETISFTVPDTAQLGVYTIPYTLSDGTDSVDSTITLTVTGGAGSVSANNITVFGAVGDEVTIDFGSATSGGNTYSLTTAGTSYVSPDTTAFSDVYTAQVGFDAPGADGIVTVTGRDTISFTLAGSAAVGSYTIPYEVSDGTASAFASITLDVRNTQPTATPISTTATYPAGATLLFADHVADANTADSDLRVTFTISEDNFDLGLTSGATEEGGTYSIASAATSAIFSNPNPLARTYTGTYTVHDAHGDSASSTVTITLLAGTSPNPLTVPSPTYNVAGGLASHEITITTLSFTDPAFQTDPTAINLFVDATGDKGGTASIARTNPDAADAAVYDWTLTYTPADPDAAGDEVFNYAGAIGDRSGTGTITIAVGEAMLCSSEATGDLDFGELSIGEPSASKPITVTNDGTQRISDIMIKGTNWGDGSEDKMPVSATKFGTGLILANPAELSTSDSSLGTAVSPSSSQTIYLRVVPELLDTSGPTKGELTQTITITTVC